MLHEDDALRAVRAAAGMQSALAELNGELERFYGVQLANRTGVNTGEVVAGDPTTGQRLVTGDAVNVAARLEQAAGEREVLLADLPPVRDHVEVEEVEPLALKGKAEPVPAYRLVGVRDTSDVDVRRGAPLVGRDDELAARRGPRRGGDDPDPAPRDDRRRCRHGQVTADDGSRPCRARAPSRSRGGACPTATGSRSGPSPRR